MPFLLTCLIFACIWGLTDSSLFQGSIFWSLICLKFLWYNSKENNNSINSKFFCVYGMPEISLGLFCFVCFCGPGNWTQSLQTEKYPQPCFHFFSFEQDVAKWPGCLGCSLVLIFLPQPPKVLELQACITTSSSSLYRQGLDELNRQISK